MAGADLASGAHAPGRDLTCTKGEENAYLKGKTCQKDNHGDKDEDGDKDDDEDKAEDKDDDKDYDEDQDEDCIDGEED